MNSAQAGGPDRGTQGFSRVFDLSDQVEEYHRASRLARAVLLGMGVLVALAGLWILLIRGPQLEVGAFGKGAAGVILALGAVEIVGSLLIGRAVPFTRLQVTESHLRFRGEGTERTVVWTDPELDLLLADLTDDPRTTEVRKRTVGVTIGGKIRIPGGIPREASQEVLRIAGSLGLSVQTTVHTEGPTIARHVVRLSKIGPRSAIVAPASP